jgi:hypothetical protein
VRARRAARQRAAWSKQQTARPGGPGSAAAGRQRRSRGAAAGSGAWPHTEPPARRPRAAQAEKARAADLHQQLAAARAEAAHWREQHAALLEQQQQRGGAGDGRDDAAGAPDAAGTSLGKMQERLARLRKEAADAESAQAAAWEDVKAVVADIAQLASVDNLQSVRGRGGESDGGGQAGRRGRRGRAAGVRRALAAGGTLCLTPAALHAARRVHTGQHPQGRVSGFVFYTSLGQA